MEKEAFLPFALPDIDDSDVQAVVEVLRSGWITTGPKVREFEASFAEAVGATYAVAVNSCTAAMHLALIALKLRPGDEVITTPYTFAATAEVIRYFDARPVFVDIDAQSLNLCPDLIEAAITPHTRAILPVHIAGLPGELDAIQAIADTHGLPVIEDAAHAFPAQYKGRMIGSLSAITCFSFYATKTITTAEGGMICTNNSEWAEQCRMMSLHGISKDAWKRYTAEGSWYYEILAPGYKYNLTDVAAAMGLAQLHKAEQMRLRREEIAQCYNLAFAKHPELQLPHDRPDCQHAWHLYTLRLKLDQLCLGRAEFIEELKQRGIGASVHFIPLHLHPYYRETYGYQPEDFPVASREYAREVSLPIYSAMNSIQVQRVIDAVCDIVFTYRK